MRCQRICGHLNWPCQLSLLDTQVNSVDFRNKAASYFISKKEFTQIAENCNSGQECYSKNHRPVWRTKKTRRACLYWGKEGVGLGGVILNESPLEEKESLGW